MPALLLALERGASLVLTEAQTGVLGRGSKTRLKHRKLSRTAAVCTLEQRAGQAAAVSVTAGRAAVAVVRRGSDPAAFQLLPAGASTVLQDGDSLYLMPASGRLRFGYKIISLPANGGGGSSISDGAVVPAATQQRRPVGKSGKEADEQPGKHSGAAAGSAAAIDPAAAAAAAAEAREARAAAAAAAEARIAAAAARHTTRAVAAVNQARQGSATAEEQDAPQAAAHAGMAAAQRAATASAAGAAAAPATGQGGAEVVDLTLSDSDEEPQPAAAKRPRLAAGGGSAGAAVAAEGSRETAAGAMPAAAGGRASGSGSTLSRLAPSVAAAADRTATARGSRADLDGSAGLLARQPGVPAAEGQQAQQAQRRGTAQHSGTAQLLPPGGSSMLHLLKLQQKLQEAEVLTFLLRLSFEGPLVAQRIEAGQLAAALAALRRPRVPLPMADPAEQHTFSVLSYNIWYDSTCGPQRLAAIGRLIQQAPLRLPDFVLLQEMTHFFYLQLAAMPWWQAYHATPMPPPPPAGAHYFTTVLWRRDALAGAQCHPPRPFQQSGMGRDIKAVTGSLGGTPLRVCTTHLESPLGGPKQTMWAERRAQMEEMLPLLDYSPEANCLVAGDMNWIPINGVDEPVPLPPGWQDVWLALRPGEDGWTYDTEVCYQKGRKWGRGSRLDRMFCRLHDWEPLAVEMVGQEPIPGLTRVVRTGKTARSDKTIPVWPSDHFGLFAVFARKQRAGSG